jgi:hypothetical protein
VTLVQELGGAAKMPFIDILFADLGYSIRQLRSSPGFALTVILTLALGIGGNLAVCPHWPPSWSSSAS